MSIKAGKIEVETEDDFKLAMAREARRFTAKEGIGALLALAMLVVLFYMVKSHGEMAERAHGKVETLSTNIAQLTEAIHGSTDQARQSTSTLAAVASKIESLERLHEDGGQEPQRKRQKMTASKTSTRRIEE